jgi:hypothetical protein
MRMLPANDDLREMWKTFPVRFEGPRRSRCCEWPTVLVQSMNGGFVTSNCRKCNRSDSLSEADFIDRIRVWVACPECGDCMFREMVRKNYAFVCHACDVGILLADLLPRWNELRPENRSLRSATGLIGAPRSPR